MNSRNEVVKIADVLRDLGDNHPATGGSESRDISSNVMHSGEISDMQNIK